MSRFKSVFFVIFSFLVCFVYSQNCVNKETCHDCIQEFGCSWCAEPLGYTTPHCQPERTIQCTNPITPQSSNTIVKDLPLSAQENKVVQLKPQRISLKLRKNEAYQFNFLYKQAEDYPVDLYYLMDLSASMKKHKQKLGSLGEKISTTMKKLTRDFRLGFGSFVDKPTLPYVNTAKSYNNIVTIAKPYSFKNHLSLTENYLLFNKQVQAARISENIDSPEGGLDALMQAIVCNEVIGWRPKARRLLVFSTDAKFHIAGDGKLGGVVEPNDGKCHMKNNEYTDSLIYDYPSISHISNVARRNNINIVFAVSSEFSSNINKSYHELSERIENSNVGSLDTTSSNVVRLIEENYNRIVDSVTMTANTDSNIDIKFSSNCPYKKENGCTNVHVGDEIKFTATIEPLKCLEQGKNKQQIHIKPVGLDESIIIDLEVLCNCDCENKTHPTYEQHSASCSRNGDKTCGICSCDPGRYGEACECDGESQNSLDISMCQLDSNSLICSGLGICKCNKCICNQRSNPAEKISGKYCECNNYNCYRKNDILCNGNGECDCGVCKCNPGWSGEVCDCRSGNSTCIAPGDKEVCSGHGDCNCGRCECIVDENKYSGKFCEECISCPSQRCEELRPCVECQAYKSGTYDQSQCLLHCTSFETTIVPEFNSTLDTDFKRCTIFDQEGCRIVFQYKYDSDLSLVVEALKDKVCLGPPNILAWILGVIGSILLAGIIMLIVWKVCTTIHDRREYARFEDERQKLKWHSNENPLYRGATSTFTNPFFKKNRFSMPSSGQPMKS